MLEDLAALLLDELLEQTIDPLERFKKLCVVAFAGHAPTLPTATAAFKRNQEEFSSPTGAGA
jgi:hypothetical protein